MKVSILFAALSARAVLSAPAALGDCIPYERPCEVGETYCFDSLVNDYGM